MGTRDLFNEGDMLFIDYDKNGKMGSGEGIAIEGNMGMGDALSVDPDKSDSFDKNGTGAFTVYYMPGGKGDINHGSMINLTAMVDYSDPTAIDEKDVKSSTTLNYDGVKGEVKAYAIPHSTNGTGDKANVRVRCETATGCRVFLECWDDDGTRGLRRSGHDRRQLVDEVERIGHRGRDRGHRAHLPPLLPRPRGGQRDGAAAHPRRQLQDAGEQHLRRSVRATRRV